MMRRAAVLILTFTLVACGGADGARPIGRRWTHETSGSAAPPGTGPERRVLIALSSGGAELTTVGEENGVRVEGPLAPVFATEHAPVATGATIVVASSIGKVVGYALTGTMLFSVPQTPIGVTSPMRVAKDGTLRIGTASGRLLALAADGTTIFDVTVGGPIVSAPALDVDDTTFVATDTGQLAGFDASGARVFAANVSAPASGPAAQDGRVAVGELDGVRVFGLGGAEIFRRARAARVVGTRFLEGGDLLAWGEDGVVERLDPTGRPRFSFTAGPPIYAEVLPLASGGFAVLDSAGGAHRLDADGTEVSNLDLGGAPLREIAHGDVGFVFLALGKAVVALDFELR